MAKVLRTVRGTFGRKKTEAISPSLLNQQNSMSGTTVFGVREYFIVITNSIRQS